MLDPRVSHDWLHTDIFFPSNLCLQDAAYYIPSQRLYSPSQSQNLLLMLFVLLTIVLF